MAQQAWLVRRILRRGVFGTGLQNSPKGECNVDTGIVKWFNNKKGFGFITPEDGGEDLFVHYSNISAEGYKTLQNGQKVQYEPSPGRKGTEATNVTLCE